MDDLPTWTDFRFLEWISLLKHFENDIIAREFPRLDQYRNNFLAFGNMQQSYDRFKSLSYLTNDVAFNPTDS
jgi:hypothetical protein